MVWVSFDGGPTRVAWHLWHDEALWLVCGGLEQDLPGAAGAHVATVTLGGAPWEVAVGPVVPGSPEWDVVVPLLHEKRRNAPDGEAQPQRWATESSVLKLTPTR
ncbi:MAG: hypothetical protein WCD35_00565 [Mycobacteriales bacterium]